MVRCETHRLPVSGSALVFVIATGTAIADPLQILVAATRERCGLVMTKPQPARLSPIRYNLALSYRDWRERPQLPTTAPAD